MFKKNKTLIQINFFINMTSVRSVAHWDYRLRSSKCQRHGKKHRGSHYFQIKRCNFGMLLLVWKSLDITFTFLLKFLILWQYEGFNSLALFGFSMAASSIVFSYFWLFFLKNTPLGLSKSERVCKLDSQSLDMMKVLSIID